MSETCPNKFNSLFVIAFGVKLVCVVAIIWTPPTVPDVDSVISGLLYMYLASENNFVVASRPWFNCRPALIHIADVILVLRGLLC